MKITLLRHGEAVEMSEWKGTDSDRPLTEKGREKMEEISKSISRLGWKFDLVFSSPYQRAKATAEIVVGELNIAEPIRVSEAMSCEGDMMDIVKELKELDSNFERILMVGHEPHLSSLISFLITGETSYSFEMKKGGLCRLALDSLSEEGRCARLLALIPPKVL